MNFLADRLIAQVNKFRTKIKGTLKLHKKQISASQRLNNVLMALSSSQMNTTNCVLQENKCKNLILL